MAKYGFSLTHILPSKVRIEDYVLIRGYPVQKKTRVFAYLTLKGFHFRDMSDLLFSHNQTFKLIQMRSLAKTSLLIPNIFRLLCYKAQNTIAIRLKNLIPN